MKINTGQFTENYFPSLESISVIVRNYTYWLNKKYGKSMVITPYESNHVDTEPFDIVRYRKGLTKFDKTLRERFADDQFDILHAHSPFHSGKIALQIAKERNIPIVASIHTDYISEIKHSNKLFSKYAIKKIIHFYEQVDMLFSDSEVLINKLINNGYKGQVRIIRNGTDYAYNKEVMQKERSYIEHLYDISEDTNVLLYVGRLSWKNHMKLIIEALMNLRKLRQKFKMIFIGDGYARDEMIKLVDENKLNRYVIFAGEMNDRDQLKKYYMRSNLLLYPSPTNTSGLVIREAAAYRTPTLALRDVSEIIKDNYNGYLADNNSLSYAQRIISALNDRNKERVGINAQETLATNFEKIIDEVYEQYIDIIRAKKQY